MLIESKEVERVMILTTVQRVMKPFEADLYYFLRNSRRICFRIGNGLVVKRGGNWKAQPDDLGFPLDISVGKGLE